MSAIATNLQAVRQRISAAAQAAGSNAGEIGLLAVSKTWPAEALRSAADSGQRAFGAKHLQEALGKQEALADLEAAVAEGATIVRIGTAIFGERDYA